MAPSIGARIGLKNAPARGEPTLVERRAVALKQPAGGGARPGEIFH